MSVKLHFDTAGNIENPTLVLAYKSGNKIGNIFNIDSLVFSEKMINDSSTFEFNVYKKIDDNIYRDWDKLTDFKLLWVPEWDKWFSLTVDTDSSNELVKKCEAISLGDAELSQIKLYNIEINTEDDIARDAYIPTVLYNPENKEGSLLDRIMEKTSYTIKHVDKSIASIQRTFKFDNKTLIDAFQDISDEIGCLFIFDSGSDENGKPARTISVYDLYDICTDCGYRDTSIDVCPECGKTNIINGYGDDTTVFINRDNLADEITYTTDTDSVKNCFKLEAGDDLMTAAIRACNPNGTDYIWLFSDEMKDDMSDELQSKLNEYDKLYYYYRDTATIDITSSLLTSYNNLITKYSKYQDNLTSLPSSITGYSQLMEAYYSTVDMALLLESSLMPGITVPEYTAQQQVELLTSEMPSTIGTTSVTALSLSSADNMVLSYVRSVLYSAFKVEIGKSSLNGTTWSGNFVITNYADSNDTSTSQYFTVHINENYEQYVKQRIDKILNKADQDVYGITGLFNQSDDVFKSELKKYSLNRLNSFYSACQACLDIMIQSNVADSNSDYKDLYDALYVPYLNKLQYIQNEINVRDKEIRIIQGYINNQGNLVDTGLQQELLKKRDEIQDILNLQNYLGTDLWKEFASFRREDLYQNTNYISDGLNNTELFQNAKEFIVKATQELYKSSNLQHSITSTLKNFLRMKEFAPIVNHFKLGNWIRVEIDNVIYKLRLIEYEIDFEDLNNIRVTFSDVEKLYNGYSDIKSILNSAQSISTSYDSLKRQSTINSNGVNKVNNWIQKGLDMTNLKIISDADMQNISWDEHGFLCRQYNEVLSDYNPTQLKIINNGAYITDDNWKHARTGIGKFIYFDPKDSKYKEGFGVIADTIVSNIILSNEVGIYNTEKSIEMGKNGIIVTTNTAGKNVFTIQKEYTDDDGNVFLERQLYIDDNGNIVLGGGSKISWENVIGGSDYVNNVIGNVEVDITNLQNFVNQNVESLQNQIDGKIDTYRQDTDPSLAWSDEEKPNHVGDWWYDTNTQTIKVYNGATWDISTADVPEEVWNQISGKAQIFTTIPTPPYNVGDLWVQGENGDIMRCKVAKVEGDTYDSSDWVKASKYTDDTTANEALGKVNDLSSDYNALKGILGYNGTTITGTYIYSPHIVGGDISIGSSSSGVQAQITSDGKLTATGAEISGAIYATALTLGSGVKIDYSNISNTPTIPDTSIFISKDGIIGSTPSDGTTGFTVSSNGLLQASNAIIYGTIYASSGLIGGFSLNSNCLYSGNSYLGGSGVYVSPNGISCNSTFKVTSSGFLTAKTGEIAGFTFSDTLNDSTHAYANTLYRIINGSDGYDYQAGIKAASKTNGETEAAFYVRKKLSSESSWANSTLPFYVRNNGLVYCEDLTVGNSLYMYGSTLSNIDADDNFIYESKRFEVASVGADEILIGNLSNNGWYISCGNSGGEFDIICGSDIPLSIWQNQYNGKTEYYIFPPTTNIEVDLGSIYNSFRDVYCQNVRLGCNNRLYFEDSDGTSYDMIYTRTNTASSSGNVFDEFLLGSNVLRTTIRGNTIHIGNGSSGRIYMDNTYGKTTSNAVQYLVIDSNGLVSTSTSGGSSGSVSSISLKINGTTRTGTDFTSYDLALKSHTHSNYATQTWVKGAFGDTLSISGTTLTLKNYNGGTLSSVTLPSSSGSSDYPSYAYASDGTARPIVTTGTGSTQKVAYFTTNSSTQMNVKAQGGSSSYRTYYVSMSSSDIRLKSNILNTAIKGLPVINSIQLRQFDWMQNGKHQKIGVVADELELIDSNLVVGGGYEDDGTMIVKTVDTFYLQGYEIKAIQELSEQNSSQQEEISSQKEEISSLKSQNQQQQDTINQLMNQLLLLQGEVSILKDKMEEITHA